MGRCHWEAIWAYAQIGLKTLEFGSGGSTLWVADHWPGYEWVAVEHQEEWYRSVWQALRERQSNVSLLLARSEETYAYPPVPENHFGLIIIDGKHRNACLAAATTYLAPQGVIALHDSERNYTIPDGLRIISQSVDSGWEQNPNTELTILERA